MAEEETGKKHCTAVLLAGGRGSRMKSGAAKQFMTLGGKPLLWYSLMAIQRSDIIDDCILVLGGGDEQSGKADSAVRTGREIVRQYNFTKVTAFVQGGSERCWSVENAMSLLRERRLRGGEAERTDYVFIHDSARPFLTGEILSRTYEAVRKYRACVAAMPSKDTVKLADESGFAAETPDRSRVWTIQTPQVFEADLILDAYDMLRREYGQCAHVPVTDDAGVVERFTDVPVKFAEGSYHNIKITTPEDMKIAEVFLESFRFC